MKKIVIFDLDGTLALIHKRRALAAKPNGKLNWKVFFDPDNISLDEPNWPVITMFNLLQNDGVECHIFSGRDSISKDATLDWLNGFGIFPDSLTMRPQGSHTPDDILKKDWLTDFLSARNLTKDNILCIYDDRDKVVNMWRANGLTCFQVAPGDF